MDPPLPAVDDERLRPRRLRRPRRRRRGRARRRAADARGRAHALRISSSTSPHHRARSLPAMLLYDVHASGNCYKVRLLLTLLGIPFERIERGHEPAPRAATELLGGKNPALRVPVLAARRRPASRGVERDPLVSRRGDGVRARRTLRARAGAPVDVLRAVRPRAVHRRRPPPHARSASSTRIADTEQRRRARLRGARRDGGASRRARVLRRGRSTRSPTSRSTRTRTSRTRAASTSRVIRRSARWLARVAAQPGHIPITA